ncbi:MAG: methionyl-tRNA formyltransferase, partial [Verrucomicrobiales bacterium]
MSSIEPSPLPIVFFGTAPLAAVSLEALAARPEFQIVAVVSQPDKPAGRDLKLQPSAVKAAAEKLNLQTLQPIKARNPEFIEQLRSLKPSVMVVAAYGQILPQALLDVPPHGCLNVHTSLLPKYRGAAPIQWSILNGDQETGVTIMKMDAGLDTGPILSTVRTPILPEDNSQTLHDRLARLGADLLVVTIPQWVSGQLPLQPQPEGGSYARKISKEDGEIVWIEPALIIWNKVRGLTPWPGAFTFYDQGGKLRMLKIWQAQVEQGNGEPGVILDAGKAGILVGTGS